MHALHEQAVPGLTEKALNQASTRVPNRLSSAWQNRIAARTTMLSLPHMHDSSPGEGVEVSVWTNAMSAAGQSGCCRQDAAAASGLRNMHSLVVSRSLGFRVYPEP